MPRRKILKAQHCHWARLPDGERAQIREKIGGKTRAGTIARGRLPPPSFALTLLGTLLLGILPGPIIAITRHVAELIR